MTLTFVYPSVYNNILDMYDDYQQVRGGIAVPKDSLHQIDASGSNQICNIFGVHPNLSHIKALYDEEDLLWINNMGVLQQPTTKDNWWSQNEETEVRC